MSVDAQVDKYLAEDIPNCRSNLSKSHMELRNLAEHCHRDLTPVKPPLQRTMVYAAQSLASVAYQINTLATLLVDLLKLQGEQWGEMEHQITDISQQANFFQEKHSRHLIGKFTTEKPVHLMRRVNPPSQKEIPGKYERHPINYTIWDHIGHGSPTRDSTPAVSNTAKKPPGSAVRTSFVSTSKPILTTQNTIDSDIYGTSFDVLRYSKRPVAHAIPVAIPRSDNPSDMDKDFTNTTEMFVQGHTTDSLYDSLAAGGDGTSSVSEKPQLTISMSDTLQDTQDTEASIFTPSPLPDIVPAPLPSAQSPEHQTSEIVNPDLTTDLLDTDLYSEDVISPPTDLPPPPIPDSVDTPKPPRPINPAPSRPPPVSGENPPSRYGPAGAPPEISAPPPASPASMAPPPSRPPPPPITSIHPSRPAPSPAGAGVRPIRPAPSPSAAGAKISTDFPPPAPFVDDPNIPSPPPDMPKPVVADSRIPAPPPNIPKDGIKKVKSSVSDASASSVKKERPKPEKKGFDPSDILKMQQSLKKRGQIKTGATIDVPTEEKPVLKPPSLVASQSVPLPSAPLSPPPASTGATAHSSGDIPDPPPDIPQGWTKKPVGVKTTPVVKKTPPPKQARGPAFDPSQILARKRPSKESTSTPPANKPEPKPEVVPEPTQKDSTEDSSAPANYIEKVITIYPYKALKEDELNFSKGKVIYVLKKNPDEWYEGLMDGVRGLFPANYVKKHL
ncbi:Abl interactor 2-like isoform X2 [Oopsacas minuta]|uniref:Abl interactor 2-like isoform X2 n=1 Tax=Oopsacas minuta TaxID=111878 RepID=A0AAV7JBQ3_9METZ|nr:Abl interactor 2-like isoform X2 [Oopsacas minuta]